MDDAVAQHDILDVVSSSNRLSSFIMKHCRRQLLCGARGCVRPSAYLMVSAVTRFGMPLGVTHDPHEVGGAQRRSRRLFLTASRFCFCFQSRGPTPSEAAGGRPLTQRSKTLGPRKRGAEGARGRHGRLCGHIRPADAECVAERYACVHVQHVHVCLLCFSRLCSRVAWPLLPRVLIGFIRYPRPPARAGGAERGEAEGQGVSGCSQGYRGRGGQATHDTGATQLTGGSRTRAASPSALRQPALPTTPSPSP